MGKKLFQMENSEKHVDEFKSITELMQMNKNLLWEAHVENYGPKRKNGTMQAFKCENGEQLLKRLLPMNAKRSLTIFEYGKGLAIKTNDEQYRVLPACKGDNHRDWSRDGICVKKPKKKTSSRWRSTI